MRDPISRFFKFEVVTDRYAAHILDLTVGDHEVGGVLRDGLSDVRSVQQLDDLIFPIIEHGSQIVEDTSCVTYCYDVGHYGRLSHDPNRSTIDGPSMASIHAKCDWLPL